MPYKHGSNNNQSGKHHQLGKRLKLTDSPWKTLQVSHVPAIQCLKTAISTTALHYSYSAPCLLPKQWTAPSVQQAPEQTCPTAHHIWGKVHLPNFCGRSLLLSEIPSKCQATNDEADCYDALLGIHFRRASLRSALKLKTLRDHDILWATFHNQVSKPAVNINQSHQTVSLRECSRITSTNPHMIKKTRYSKSPRDNRMLSSDSHVILSTIGQLWWLVRLWSLQLLWFSVSGVPTNSMI